MRKNARPKGPFDSFTIAGNTAELVIPNSAISYPNSFDWITTTIAREEGKGDRAPDKGHRTAWLR